MNGTAATSAHGASAVKTAIPAGADSVTLVFKQTANDAGHSATITDAKQIGLLADLVNGLSPVTSEAPKCQDPNTAQAEMDFHYAKGNVIKAVENGCTVQVAGAGQQRVALSDAQGNFLVVVEALLHVPIGH